MSRLGTDFLLKQGINAVNLVGGIDLYGQKFDKNVFNL